MQRPQRVLLRDVPDVASKNLPPEAELDALLQGTAGYGKTLDVIRVAVPPFETTGLPAQRAWLGEAAADELMAGLTRMPGVTVLERKVMSTLIAERKKASDPELASSGKILGAQMIVLGRLVPEGDHMTLALRPVKVATAASAKGFTLPVDPTKLQASMDAAVAQFGADLGIAPAALRPTDQPLAAADLEAVSLARALQYDGKLLEAQPLYAKALAKPSSAWRFEADYLDLMADLGMFDWVEARAKDLLARMPVADDTMCDRARVFVQKNRAKHPVDDAREAVRMAASCGEPELIAQSLFYLAFTMERIDYPMAIAANHRASKILGTANPWTRCAIDWQAADYDTLLGGDWHGSREQLFAGIADRCEHAGNFIYASVALDSAAAAAWLPARRRELFDRSLSVARQAGGRQLDVTAELAAADLRTTGLPTQADALLLERIGSRLHALEALYGVLPDDVAVLDDDLLGAAGVVRKPGTPRTDLGDSEKLLAAVHREGLAEVLRAWAARTKSESLAQAQNYAMLADKLSPSREGAGDLQSRLDAAKLPLAAIAGDQPPLRASGAIVRNAWNAVLDEYWATRRPELVATLGVLASWFQAPAMSREALRVAALRELDAGNFDAALGNLRVSERYAKDDPAWSLVINDGTRQVFEKKGDSAKVLETRRARIAIAERVSPQAWIAAQYAAGVAEIRAKAGDGQDVVKGLRIAAEQLETKQAWEPAALALLTTARLLDDIHGVAGSAEDVQLYRRRVELLDHLGDPLRSLEARAELLEAIDLSYFEQYGSAKSRLAGDPDVVKLVAELTPAITKLAESGHPRDAVRLVGKLVAVAPGVEPLLAKSLEWARAFDKSAEYPALVGKIHDHLSRVTDDHQAIVKEARLAHDTMQTAAPSDALWEYSRIISYTDGEPAMWKAFEQCTSEAPAVPLRRGCWWGLYYWVVRMGVLTDATKAKQALHVGSELAQAIDGKLAERDRAELRESLGMIALFAGDRDAFDASAANGSVGSFMRLGRIAAGAHDYKRAAALFKRAHESVKTQLFHIEVPLAVAAGFSGDVAAGLAAITPVLEHGTSHCEGIAAYEVATALELAAGHCPRAAELRKKAQFSREAAAASGEQCAAATWKGTNHCKAPFAGTFPIEQAP